VLSKACSSHVLCCVVLQDNAHERTRRQGDGCAGGGRVKAGGVLLDGTIINDWFKKKANQKLRLFLSFLRIFAGKNKMAGNSPAGPPN